MHRLLSSALAAEEWGWGDRMRLREGGTDECLRELLEYVGQHHRRAWYAVPCFREVFRMQNATDEAENILEIRMSSIIADNRLVHDDAWFMRSVSICAVPLVRICVQSLDSLEIFFVGNSGIPPLDLCLLVRYMVDENCNGFYYIHALDWICRCPEARECAEVLDAIEADSLSLMSEYNARMDASDLYWHLHFTRGFINDDEPRSAYVQRAMCAIERLDSSQEFCLG
jgi:hypothetical protein